MNHPLSCCRVPDAPPFCSLFRRWRGRWRGVGGRTRLRSAWAHASALLCAVSTGASTAARARCDRAAGHPTKVSHSHANLDSQPPPTIAGCGCLPTVGRPRSLRLVCVPPPAAAATPSPALLPLLASVVLNSTTLQWHSPAQPSPARLGSNDQRAAPDPTGYKPADSSSCSAAAGCTCAAAVRCTAFAAHADHADYLTSNTRPPQPHRSSCPPPACTLGPAPTWAHRTAARCSSACADYICARSVVAKHAVAL